MRALIALLIAMAAAAQVPDNCLRYRARIVRESQAEWGLNAPSASFAAQLAQESRCRTDLVSPVGARGMGQFMPATARWAQHQFPGLSPESSESPVVPGTRWGVTNPAWDIRALIVYDHWLYARVGAINRCERMAKAMRAYNGGLGWIYRDESKATAMGINPGRNFGALDRVNAGRSAANFRQNVDYPRRILLKAEPDFIRAAFGTGVCN